MFRMQTSFLVVSTTVFLARISSRAWSLRATSSATLATIIVATIACSTTLATVIGVITDLRTADRAPLFILIQTQADVFTELNFPKSFSRLHFIDVLEKRLVMRFENLVYMGPRIDKQALPDILDCQGGLLSNVKFVEALSDYLVQVFIKKLSHAHQSILERETSQLIFIEVLPDSLSLVFAEFFGETLVEVFDWDDRFFLGCEDRLTTRSTRITSRWRWLSSHEALHTDQEFLQTVDHFALILIKSETANYLIYAVGHVELIQITTIFGQICLIQRCWV